MQKYVKSAKPNSVDEIYCPGHLLIEINIFLILNNQINRKKGAWSPYGLWAPRMLYIYSQWHSLNDETMHRRK